MQTKPPPPPKSRDARLAEALKRNIFRRKASQKQAPQKPDKK
jgi:hypothetical protein